MLHLSDKDLCAFRWESVLSMTLHHWKTWPWREGTSVLPLILRCYSTSAGLMLSRWETSFGDDNNASPADWLRLRWETHLWLSFLSLKMIANQDLDLSSPGSFASSRRNSCSLMLFFGWHGSCTRSSASFAYPIKKLLSWTNCTSMFVRLMPT